MAGDSPSPPRHRGDDNPGRGSSLHSLSPSSTNGSSSARSTQIRAVLIVSCVLLLHLIYTLTTTSSGSGNHSHDDQMHRSKLASYDAPVDKPGPYGSAGHADGHGPIPSPIRKAEQKVVQAVSDLKSKLKLKFRNLFAKKEFSGYGPARPRVAVVIVGEGGSGGEGDRVKETLVGCVESVFRHTDRNRLLAVTVLLDGQAPDPDFTSVLENLNSGDDVPHYHGDVQHDHTDPQLNKGKDNADKKEPKSQADHEHGAQKVFVFYSNSKGEPTVTANLPQGMAASRSDGVEFVNILIRKQEEAGLKLPEEEIILLFLRSDARLTSPDWLDDIQDELMPYDSEGNVIYRRRDHFSRKAVSVMPAHPDVQVGDTVTVTPALTLERSSGGAKGGTAEGVERAASTGSSYLTPIVSNLATAMRIDTYNSLPAQDDVLTSAMAADLELSLNLWLCGDGISILPKPMVRLDRDHVHPHDYAEDMTEEETARIMAAWMSDTKEGKAAVYAARSAQPNGKGSIDVKTARRLQALVKAERGEASLPKDLKHQCKPFSSFDRRFHLGLGGQKADENNAPPTLPPVKKAGASASEGDISAGTKRLPTKPLDPTRRKMIESTEMVDITFVDVSEGHKTHPHVGAKDENGKLGYVHDATFLRKNPPKFELSNKKEVCNKHDANHIMLTKKVHIDFDADAAAEKKAKETGKPRPKILCVLFTIEKYHHKLAATTKTWGPKCDGIIYASDKTDRVLGTVNVPHEGKEEYNNIWQKNRSIWAYVYDNYYNDYDWFHSGGDDVYILMENLRLYLESEEIQVASNGGTYLPNGDERIQTPLFLGRRFAEDGDMNRIFNSGGSGYTLNKAALKNLVVTAMPKCMPHRHTFSEDVMVARCLRNYGGVLPYDTKDEKGGERYMPFQPGHHLTYRPPEDIEEDWYAYSCIDCKWGLDHCAARSVAFHYIKPALMDRMHGLLYGYCNDT